ncbi:MAG: hypothetical protein ACR2HJ_08260 [Fimbriimonadales bacterium]
MSENMERFRSMDGSDARIKTEFVDIIFQHGAPQSVGVNGCRVEDVIDLLIKKLLDFQGRELACEENADALNHLQEASDALVRRGRRREQQGVLGTREDHKVEQEAGRNSRPS